MGDSEEYKKHLREIIQTMGKNILCSDKVLEYTRAHSEPIHSVQSDLIKYTRETQDAYFMLTDIGENQFFNFLIKLIGAKKVLDVGCFTGLSALSLALALPDDGKVTTLDISNTYEDIAKSYWKKAGVDNKIELIIQDAKVSMQELRKSQEGTFDFIFIDSDKPSYDTYYELALKLIKKGGIIAIDNVLFFGSVTNDINGTDKESKFFFKTDEFKKNTQSIQNLNDKISKDSRVYKTVLPLADGITLVTKK